MSAAPVSCIPNSSKMTKIKKVLDEAREYQNPELDLVDKNVTSFEDMPGILTMINVTRVTLSHNKLKSVPAALANLANLEILNLANNAIDDLPLSLSSMPKLRILNLSFNKLSALPRGFGAFPVLEVLDLTYNFLSEKNLPGNFFMMETLRALYLGDNEFEYIPTEIKNLKNLQILVFRENDIIEVPKEIAEIPRLRELHLQCDRLTLLPPEIGHMELISGKSVFRLDGNEWVPPIAVRLRLGISHLMEYLRSGTYRLSYNRYQQHKPEIPLPCLDKDQKKAAKQR